MDQKYEAIIDLPRPVSPRRPRMSLSQRAAQFAPFAALTGYDAVLAETARRTEAEISLDEGEVAAINERLCWVKENLEDLPKVQVKVFCPDGRKSGGSYHVFSGRIVKVDEYTQKLWLETGEQVEFKRIIQLLIC